MAKKTKAKSGRVRNDERLTARFRFDGGRGDGSARVARQTAAEVVHRSAVMVVPSQLKQTGALAVGETFIWPALSRALGIRGVFASTFRLVTATGWEGTPVGSELVVHVA